MGVELLDCTLRDGGYVNNWEFGTERTRAIMAGLYDSGVRIIEIGIQGNGGAGTTKFESFERMAELLRGRRENCKYALMCNQSNIDNFTIPQRSESTVDIIRLAYFKREMNSALENAARLKAKGYEVYLQAMATFMYGESCLLQMIDLVNALLPCAFYIVDSFSTMYRDDVIFMARKVKERLDGRIKFGFHAHNNMLMAYSNMQSFIECCTDRDIVVDSSVYGMGRGGGNVPTELAMKYLNKAFGTEYDTLRVLRLFQDWLKDVYKDTPWGYAPEYFLTADKSMNSVYGWYFKNKGIKDIALFNALLDEIPHEVRYTLSKADADNALAKCKKDAL